MAKRYSGSLTSPCPRTDRAVLLGNRSRLRTSKERLVRARIGESGHPDAGCTSHAPSHWRRCAHVSSRPVPDDARRGGKSRIPLPHHTDQGGPTPSAATDDPVYEVPPIDEPLPHSPSPYTTV